MKARIGVLDPEGALLAREELVELQGPGTSVTCKFCCPHCRRPFALDLSVQEVQEGCGGVTLALRLYNAQDKAARWVAAVLSTATLAPLGAGAEVASSCPHCRREFPIRVFVGDADAGLAGECLGEPCKEPRNSFAYATLLYGTSAEYFIGSLVLGWSLLHPAREPAACHRHRRILLHTDDVPSEYLAVLSKFWELRRVAYLTASERWYYDYQGSRFKQVFTKLQVLSLTEFDKVLMLDLDMLVRRNIDELFDLPAPAALKRPGGREQPLHGQRIEGDRFWKWRKLEDGEAKLHNDSGQWRYDMSAGINAGVMLLQPDESVYRRMLAEIGDDAHPAHVAAYGPEQEYLGAFYSTFGPGWTHMDSRFNYQPMLGGCANQFMRELDAQVQLAITHFSGPRVKPWRGVQPSGPRGGPLTASGVRQLLEESDDLFHKRFPENPKLPPTGGERSGDWGYPTLVVALVREWAVSLRAVAQQLHSEHGTDIVSVIGAVECRNRSIAVKRFPALFSVLRRLQLLCSPRSRVAIAIGALLLLLRSLARRAIR